MISTTCSRDVQFCVSYTFPVWLVFDVNIFLLLLLLKLNSADNSGRKMLPMFLFYVIGDF